MGRGKGKPRMEISWQRDRIVLILCLVEHGFRRLREITDMLWLQSKSAMLVCWIRPMLKDGLLCREEKQAGTLALTEQGRALLKQHAVVWKEGRPVEVLHVEWIYE